MSLVGHGQEQREPAVGLLPRLARMKAQERKVSDNSIPQVPAEKACVLSLSIDGASTSASPEWEDRDETELLEFLDLPRSLRVQEPASTDEHGIPAEWPNPAPRPSARCRCSLKTVFPIFVGEDYDPRKPEYIVAASQVEVLEEELRLLRRQMAKIVPMLSAREAAGDDESLLHGYRQAVEEAELRVPELEWALATSRSAAGQCSKAPLDIRVARGLHRFACRGPMPNHAAYFAQVSTLPLVTPLTFRWL